MPPEPNQSRGKSVLRPGWDADAPPIDAEAADAMAALGEETSPDAPCDLFAVADRVIRLGATTRDSRELGTVIDEDGDDVLVWFEDHRARPVARRVLRRLGVPASTDRRAA